MIAHLVHWEQLQGGTLLEVVQRVIPQLRGAYGTVVMDSRDPSVLVAARSGSPLVIGRGVGENFIASDQLALLPVTRRFIFLEEGDVVEVTQPTVNIFDKQGNAIERPEIESQVQYDAGDKGAYRVTTCKRDLRTAAGAEKHPGRAFQPWPNQPERAGPARRRAAG